MDHFFAPAGQGLRLVADTPTITPFFAPALIAQVTDRRVRRIMQTMHNDLAQPHHLEEFLVAVGLSASQLEKLFLAATGYAPMQYLQRLRLEQAAWLLINSDLQVKAVRQQVGISDVSNFAHAFKRAFGCAPRAYRAKMQRREKS